MLASKTRYAWTLLILGSTGLPRLARHGWSDPIGWLWFSAFSLGGWGFLRLRRWGLDDPWGSYLVPLLGLAISAAMLMTVVVALTPDEKWAQGHHGSAEGESTRWGPVLAAIAALFVGSTALIATIAYASQQIFESLL